MKRIRYLIGAEDGNVLEPGASNALTVVPWDYDGTVEFGESAGYCNALDEEFEKTGGLFGPYLPQGDTAREYREGQIDPRGPGWHRNLVSQFERRRREGFKIIELDNTDAYEWKFVDEALTLAQKTFGFDVLAKNPLLMKDDAVRYIRHSSICGAIVERDPNVTPEKMNELRRAADRQPLPIWFVSYRGAGYAWALDMTAQINFGNYKYMGVSHSPRSEYGLSEDVLLPVS